MNTPMTTKPLLGPLVLAAASFASTFTVLVPDSVEAKYRRVTAVSSCHPDEETHSDFGHSGVDTWVDTHNNAQRNGNGLRIDVHDNTNIGVRCEVPTDSYLPHQNMTEVHISGNKNAGNGFGSYAKACSVWFGNGSYSCSAGANFPSGNFNVALNLGNVWSSPDALPMVTAVLADEDRLYGVYYSNL